MFYLVKKKRRKLTKSQREQRDKAIIQTKQIAKEIQERIKLGRKNLLTKTLERRIQEVICTDTTFGYNPKDRVNLIPDCAKCPIDTWCDIVIFPDR